MLKKVCVKCKAAKSATIEFFLRDARHASGLRACCRECGKAKSRAWRNAHPAKSAAAVKKWKEANKARVAELGNNWQKANRAKCAAWESRHRANKFQATPIWYDAKKVQAIYARAVAKTKATGIQHHVDHRVPLQNPRVCGLHWHANLRIIPAKENLSKGNRVWENMP